ncbi:hypothetical protein [Vreelandella populi]|uniref:hypothetical protein n=1 Tax=Vreelandella populi TaxID=2498858 RepID=UPI000F8D939F|nr:hypothetical protein [Halomonas populi]RUR51422.1 hypothetical protein ELY40_16620 [Halomonas populi]
MAEYCRNCANRLFGQTIAEKKYSGLCKADETYVVLCEGCGGWVELDHEGRKVERDANNKVVAGPKHISLEEIRAFDRDAARSGSKLNLSIPSSSIIKLGLWLLAVAAMWLLFSYLLGAGDRTMSPAMVRVQQEKLIRSQLVDPDSARFSDQFHGKREGAWCGLVNAKNSLGGYTGNKRFIALSSVGFIESIMSVNEFEDLWASACR